MEFFQIFRFGGTIAVNRLSVRDMIAVSFITLIGYIILVALISLILPTILLGLYTIWMINNNGYGGDNNVKQRLTLNLMTIGSVIYYLLDFHFGWISFHIMGSAISESTLNTVASYNLTIGILSGVLFFFGHELYRLGQNKLVSIGLFLFIIYFGFKMINPISTRVVNNVITQAEYTLDTSRVEADSTYTRTDEERQVDIDKRDKAEQEREERLRQFDKDYSNGKVVDFNR